MTTPAQAARQRERTRVSRLTDIATFCRGDVWSIDTEGGATRIVARRTTGENAVLCTLHAEALPEDIELISGALENVVLFLELRRRAIVALRQGRPITRESSGLREGDFAANAAMLCNEKLFHRFLERRDGSRAIHNKEHADGILKKLLRITSKRQLNTEERAQTAFLDLRADFEVWATGRGK
ncbi:MULTISPECIES: hypothetical protein [unclassified Rhizobium]|uniref:hypothetical protein n=1 Tax=unclassified Rhizobium TaxID=2613769 RepID=UPI0038038D88